jgi:two-component system, NarL family, response regulator DegU
MIRVVIADDHPIFRNGLKQVLDEEESLVVIGEASNGEQTIEMLRQGQAHVVVLDVDMPKGDGFEVVERIRQEEWSVKPVFLTMHRDERFYARAVALGVMGYVLKDSALMEIVKCIETVHGGGQYVSGQMEGGVPEWLALLTPTEKEVLRRIAEYRTSKEIASDLGSSVRTVEHHRANIAQKLGVKGSHAVLRLALENQAQLKK